MSSRNSESDERRLEQIEEEARKVPEDRETLGRGPDVLQERLAQAAQRKKQLTMRLDQDIVSRFKDLAGPDGSYQTLMNRALHEWLDAQSVGGLLQSRLEELDEALEDLKSLSGVMREEFLVDRDPEDGGPIRSPHYLH